MVSTTLPPQVNVIVGLLEQFALLLGAVYVTLLPVEGLIEPDVVAHEYTSPAFQPTTVNVCV
jgi:hypothetical protein